MELLNNAKIVQLWSSTAAAVGTTGDAGGTTAGSTTNVGQSTGGGYPTATTGLDLTGYGGAMFIATISNSTNAVLKSGFSVVGTSAAVTGWTDLPGVYAGLNTTAPSTVAATLALDVVRPMPRFINAIVQVPSSSAVLESVIALLYNAKKVPVTQPTALSNQAVIGSTAQ